MGPRKHIDALRAACGGAAGGDFSLQVRCCACGPPRRCQVCVGRPRRPRAMAAAPAGAGDD